ncbi:MAG TPA: murein biosynthesis integral membrane protein MurJ [Thermoanaerobacterales bacterium]|nr:murein biosynthesis integral membrane protein MurJ [Thermoanaerobacterales bacterium]
MGLTREAAKAVSIVMVITIASKVMGFARDMAVGAVYGATSITDAYLVSLSIPSIVFGSAFAALSTTFIPMFVELTVQKGKDEAYKFTNNLINILFVFMIVIVLLGILFAPQLVRIVAFGFEGEVYNLAVELTRLAFPMIIFIALAYIFTGILHAQNEFTIPAAIGFPYNASILIFLFFLSQKFTIHGLVIATVIGAFLQAAIQYPSVKRNGFKYKFIFDLKDETIIKLGMLVIPVILGMSVQQLNSLVDKMLASGLAEGSISALNFANRLNGFVYGVFTHNTAVVLYPILSKFAVEDRLDALKEAIIKTTNVVLLIVIPITVGSIVLREPIVRVLFEWGQFDERAVQMTASALLYYSIGMVAFGLRDLYNRIFYSIQDTKTPMLNGIYAVIINIVLNLILVRFMAHNGLALATSISGIITTLFIINKLRKQIKGINFRLVAETFVKISVASAIMGIFVYFMNHYINLKIVTGFLPYQILSLVLCILGGFIVYMALIYLFKIREFQIIMNNLPAKILTRLRLGR